MEIPEELEDKFGDAKMVIIDRKMCPSITKTEVNNHLKKPKGLYICYVQCFNLDCCFASFQNLHLFLRLKLGITT